MRPKLAVITVTGCHLIPVICVRREPTDLDHDRAVGRGWRITQLGVIGNLSAALER
jgi:hypothetical protein